MSCPPVKLTEHLAAAAVAGGCVEELRDGRPLVLAGKADYLRARARL